MIKVLGSLLLLAILIVNGLYFYNTRFVETKDPVKAAPSSAQFVLIEGDRLAYAIVDNGAKTSVVFIGGLFAWHGTWARTIQSLGENTKYNYVALDLPPFGFSDVRAGSNYFRDTQAKRILAFLEYLSQKRGAKNFIIIAHSYGAGPSADAVIHAPPGRIARFIIIDGVLNADEFKNVSSNPITNSDYLRNLAVGIAIHSDALALRRLQSFTYLDNAVTEETAKLYTFSFDTKGTTKKLSAFARDYINDPLNYESNSLSSYGKLSMPVRIIWGDRDELTPPLQARALLSVLKDGKLILLEGVGHIPMIEDHEKSTGALKQALAE